MEEIPNVSEDADSFETGNSESFRSLRQASESMSSSFKIYENIPEVPAAASTNSPAPQMSRSPESTVRNGVAAVDKVQQNGIGAQLEMEKVDKDSDITDSTSSSPERKNKLISLRRLISHRDAFDSLLMILGTLGAVGAGCSQPLLSVLFGRLIDALSQSGSASHSQLLDKISKVCLSLFYTGIGSGIASLLGIAAWNITAERQASRIRCMYLKALLRQDVGYFDSENGVGEAMNKISSDILLIKDALGDKLADIIELSTRFLFGWGIGFYVNWKMTAVTIAAIPPVAVVGGFMAVGLTKATNQAQDAYTEAGRIVEQALGSIRTVASNTGEKSAAQKYDEALGIAEKAGIRLGYTNGIGLGIVFFVTFATYGMAMWYGSRIVAEGETTAGDVIVVIFAVVMGGSALGMAAPQLTKVASGLGAAYSMFQVIERKPLIDSQDLSGRILPSVRGEIQFKGIHFAYPTRPESPVFTNFHLLINAGSTTALVGESGSGKSSVIQLILRFYDPEKGQVLLDGVDIRELQLRWLRSQIALVSQEPVLFATSIRDNIKYGKDDATQEEIENACVLANAALFIDRLPQGYDTLVGERGTQLSGGQKQRVAIARAILKNPRILLLDEATSALDAESEQMVQDALDRVSTGQTTVVVAHRLSTIKNANLIAVVQKGVVIETGVHDELSQIPDSAYSQLIRFQQSCEENGVDKNDDQTRVMSGRFDRSKDEGSFRLPSRDYSSRRLGIRSLSRRVGSSSRLSFVSDILSISQASSASKHFDAAQGHDLLDYESDLEKVDEREDNTLKHKVSFFRLARMNKPELPFFFLAAVGSAVVGAILPMFAFALYKAIVAFQQGSARKVKEEGAFYALLFVVLGGVHLLFTPCERINFAYVGERLLRRLRLRSFERILRQEVSWFDYESNSSAKLSSRLLADAAAVKSVVGETFCTTVQAVSTAVLGLALAFSGSWQLTLVILAISPFLGLQGILNVGPEHSLNKKDKEDLDQATQVASDAVSNIRTVASFGAEEKMVELYAKKSSSAYSVNVKKGVLHGVVIGSANFSLFCAYALSFYAGGKLEQQGKVRADKIFLVFLSVALSALSIAAAVKSAPDLARCKPAIRSIFALLDRVSKIDPVDDKGVSLQHLRGRIEFKAVTFRYPTRPTVQVLQGLSFTLKSGKTLALVGESGCGKSTVISLIERFYNPHSGSILIDGVEINALNLKWLRQNIGLVSQEPVLFDDTIRSNILQGKEGNTTENEIHEAARCANAHAFISALPDGYNTRVGERGIQLSGGQKQRVAIARAILKNPKILLLDEATSALDAESEHIVQAALDRIMVKRSTITVAHRLSTVRNCDQVLVLKNGRVAEKGTYDDLLATGGIFASLVRQTFSKAN